METIIEQAQHTQPTRMWVEVPLLSENQARPMAQDAVTIARRNMPKFTGVLARELEPISGDGYFGIRWTSPAVWYQEVGIRGFTMRSLQGAIPMWVKDPTGQERRKNPRAKTKMGEDGTMRVLIFRWASRQGQRKTVIRNGTPVSVPRSWPGAPGRINVREASAPLTRTGKVGGQIAGGLGATRGNVGVRWRHPGLVARSFMYRGLVQSARAGGIDTDLDIHIGDEQWR